MEARQSAARKRQCVKFGTSAQQQEIQLRVDRGESLDRLDVDFIVADAGRERVEFKV
jgi:hypothetical protein